jgi:hypothetical protein
MSLANRVFRLQAREFTDDTDDPRWARRVNVNADVLKASKLAAGDLVAMFSAGGAGVEVLRMLVLSILDLPPRRHLSRLGYSGLR